jgi:Amt family ammonium transporter
MTPTAISAGYTAWVLISTALVMLMVPGLAFFYGGLVRGKSSLNTIMMSIAALGIVSVQWVIVGYSLAFDSGSPWIGGLSFLGFAGVGGDANSAYASGIPHVSFAAFQAMFAVITVALMSGAVVERMSFRAYVLFAVLWTTLVYDPLAHWVWGDHGWLRSLGALDFAGGTVVHVSAGAGALIAALVLGQRHRTRAPMVPHHVPFTVLGAGLLWFGWFGFNAGSALGANAVAANALITTHVAAAAALTTWMLIDLTRTGTCTAVGAATGAVVGLVAITPAAGYVSVGESIFIGTVASVVSNLMVHLKNKTETLDDTLDVFPCHGVGGMVGMLMTGIFAKDVGLTSGHAYTFFVHCGALVFVALFSFGGSWLLYKITGAIIPLRVSEDQEAIGLDVSQHGEVMQDMAPFNEPAILAKIA